MQGQSVWLWLLFGTFAAGLLIWTAIDANRKRSAPAPVAGSSPEQQKMVDEARTAIASDSTNIEAHTALGNVLYDTGNWSEAIVHYRAVMRRDSTRVPPMVDLGVCYYNLGETPQAEQLFLKALTLDPNQPIALFNLGIVSERKGRPDEARAFYDRALKNAPSEELHHAVEDAIARVSQAKPAP
jgi:Flp pilus assembly protein TadD